MAMAGEVQIEAKDGRLTGAPIPGAQYTYDGVPVSNAAAYSMSTGNFASPFASDSRFVAFNTDKLRNAILRAAEEIKKNPKKQVWAIEMHDGEVALYVGDYGNVNAHVVIGAIKDTNAAKRDPAFVNATMAEYDAEYIRRGQPPQFQGR
jgi:hypothetical protein